MPPPPSTLTPLLDQDQRETLASRLEKEIHKKRQALLSRNALWQLVALLAPWAQYQGVDAGPQPNTFLASATLLTLCVDLHTPSGTSSGCAVHGNYPAWFFDVGATTTSGKQYLVVLGLLCAAFLLSVAQVAAMLLKPRLRKFLKRKQWQPVVTCLSRQVPVSTIASIAQLLLMVAVAVLFSVSSLSIESMKTGVYCSLGYGASFGLVALATSVPNIVYLAKACCSVRTKPAPPDAAVNAAVAGAGAPRIPATQVAKVMNSRVSRAARDMLNGEEDSDMDSDDDHDIAWHPDKMPMDRSAALILVMVLGMGALFSPWKFMQGLGSHFYVWCSLFAASISCKPVLVGQCSHDLTTGLIGISEYGSRFAAVSADASEVAHLAPVFLTLSLVFVMALGLRIVLERRRLGGQLTEARDSPLCGPTMLASVLAVVAGSCAAIGYVSSSVWDEAVRPPTAQTLGPGCVLMFAAVITLVLTMLPAWLLRVVFRNMNVDLNVARGAHNPLTVFIEEAEHKVVHEGTQKTTRITLVIPNTAKGADVMRLALAVFGAPQGSLFRHTGRKWVPFLELQDPLNGILDPCDRLRFVPSMSVPIFVEGHPLPTRLNYLRIDTNGDVLTSAAERELRASGNLVWGKDRRHVVDERDSIATLEQYSEYLRTTDLANMRHMEGKLPARDADEALQDRFETDMAEDTKLWFIQGHIDRTVTVVVKRFAPRGVTVSDVEVRIMAGYPMSSVLADRNLRGSGKLWMPDGSPINPEESVADVIARQREWLEVTARTPFERGDLVVKFVPQYRYTLVSAGTGSRQNITDVVDAWTTQQQFLKRCWAALGGGTTGGVLSLKQTAKQALLGPPQVVNGPNSIADLCCNNSENLVFQYTPTRTVRVTVKFPEASSADPGQPRVTVTIDFPSMVSIAYMNKEIEKEFHRITRRDLRGVRTRLVFAGKEVVIDARPLAFLVDGAPKVNMTFSSVV